MDCPETGDEQFEEYPWNKPYQQPHIWALEYKHPLLEVNECWADGNKRPYAQG